MWLSNAANSALQLTSVARQADILMESQIRRYRLLELVYGQNSRYEAITDVCERMNVTRWTNDHVEKTV